MKVLELEANVLTRWEEFQTPEGVGIRMHIAPFARRAIAFLIDFSIISVATIIFIIALTVLMDVGDQVASAVFLVAWFFLLNFYFPLFEGFKAGRTPGKLLTKIRVIERSGGPLTLRSVFTRNFMRDLELWLPLKFIFFGDAMLGQVPGWVMPMACLWASLLILFPLFNRRRLRLGDLVSGTMVVSYPRVPLLRDLAATPDTKSKKKQELPVGIVFTPEQLSIYGVYELQVLEEVLRQAKRSSAATLGSVAKKIKNKINWQGSNREGAAVFLDAFYRAQRARLEEQMLLGKKKLTKFDDLK